MIKPNGLTILHGIIRTEGGTAFDRTTYVAALKINLQNLEGPGQSASGKFQSKHCLSGCRTGWSNGREEQNEGTF